MARAALGWSRADLAAAAKVGARTVQRFEQCEPVAVATAASLRSAFEREGVVFIERGVYIGGVVPPVGG